MQETWVRSLGQEDLLEKEMVTHSSILAWEIPWAEEPEALQSTAHREPKMTEWLDNNNSIARTAIICFNSSLKYFSLNICINWFWYHNSTFFCAWTATVPSQPVRASLAYSTVTFGQRVRTSFYDLSQCVLYRVILNHVVWGYSVDGFLLLFILCAVWTHSDLQGCVFDCSRNATKKQRNRIMLNVKIQVFWWFLCCA